MLKLNTTMKKDKINQIFKDEFNLTRVEEKKNYGASARFFDGPIELSSLFYCLIKEL